MATKDPSMTEEDASKDAFFKRLGLLAQEMIDAHGKDFTMGTLILAARFIADDKPIGRPGSAEPNA
ncbi:hypothetical protein ASILVAE211_16980 [Acidisoma silvae]|uniref:Uncharacterized protein n=2 Tax=Acidisoma silvae TaxID=2802396 RepID=A0A963YUX9_9PROT|nr:hypothetical protein [Acidisoma silvae]